MTARKNKIRPMLMREISWIGKCELDEAGGVLEAAHWADARTSVWHLHIHHITGQAREGGGVGKKGGEERFKEVETNRLRSVPCVFGRRVHRTRVGPLSKMPPHPNCLWRRYLTMITEVEGMVVAEGRCCQSFGRPKRDLYLPPVRNESVCLLPEKLVSGPDLYFVQGCVLS